MRELSRRTVLAATTVGAVVGNGEAPAQVAGPQARPDGRIPVAFIVDEGVNMIDLAGAWETFQDMRRGGRDGAKAFHLYTVAAERRLYQTTGNGPGGLKFVPDYTYDDAPQPSIISMGAQGEGGAARPDKIAWVQRMAPGADVVMSICTGAFLLARTGLIDGMRATTHHLFFDSFAEQFPNIELVRDSRFVDNGKFVCAGGLTAGIDGALHVGSRFVGEENAAECATYMEYESLRWRAGAR